MRLRRYRRACHEARSAYIDQKRGLATESLCRALRMTPGGNDCLQLHSETNGRVYFTGEIGRRRFLVAVGNGDQTFTELWVRKGIEKERFEGLRDLPLAEGRLEELVMMLNLFP